VVNQLLHALACVRGIGDERALATALGEHAALPMDRWCAAICRALDDTVSVAAHVGVHADERPPPVSPSRDRGSGLLTLLLLLPPRFHARDAR
jgi:hypothetical protein